MRESIKDSISKIVVDAKQITPKMRLSVTTYYNEIIDACKGLNDEEILQAIASYDNSMNISVNYFKAILNNKRIRKQQLKNRERRVLGGTPKNWY